MQASLTGHLVFTTLHTNDAPSAIARLLDLGLEPFLITATLEGIVAQRLVRRICRELQGGVPPDRGDADGAGADARGRARARRSIYGKGCDYCNNTGYSGRMGIFEIMLLDDDLRDLIMKHASTNVLRDACPQARHADPARDAACWPSTTA